jgi:DNA processing protein
MNSAANGGGGQLLRVSVLYRVGAPLGAVLGPRPVAVAGARNPTPEGARLAWEVGRRLAECGCSVVTGFARGIDEDATFGALEAGGRVMAVLPYLLEESGWLNPRALRLLHAAAKYGASASAVAENLVKDGRRIRAWLAVRNRITMRLAAALVVPEARFKTARWGTRHAVEHALAAGRLVVVLKPRTKCGDAVKAFEHFRRRGAAAAEDVGEAISVVESYFSRACLKTCR